MLRTSAVGLNKNVLYFLVRMLVSDDDFNIIKMIRQKLPPTSDALGHCFFD